MSIIQISGETKKKIDEIIENVKRYKNLSTKMQTGNLLYRYIEEKGMLKKLAESSDLDAVQKAQNLYRFFEIIKKFGQVSTYDRVHYFIEYVESLRIAGDDPASSEASIDENAVNILTVHAAKGLEFNVVFLVGLEQGHFPVTNRGELIELPGELIKDILPSGNYHIQEERRLFYVGMTRAKEELNLASAKDMGKKKIWKPSQFVLESLDKLQVEEVQKKISPLDSLKVFSESSSAHSPASAPKEAEVPAMPEANSVITMNVTALDDYLVCPLRYKFYHVLKIPVLMHHTAVFGMAVHEALKGYHLMRRDGKKMELAEMLELFKRAWRSEGFISREHEEKRFQEGLKVIKSYYKEEEKSKNIPTLVEESFKLTLGRLVLRGRWDRVDISDGDSVIVDYKTGEIKDRKDADKKAKESTQLLLYSIAFNNKFGYLPARTVLNFIKAGLVGTAIPTEERVEKIKETAGKVTEGVVSRKFDATPGYHCRWCAFEKICPFAEKG